MLKLTEARKKQYANAVKHIDIDWLKEQYLVKGRSTRNIANELGIGFVTVLKRLHEYGISVRKHTRNNVSDETKIKISSTLQGIMIEEWDGYVKARGYCPKFNDDLKEKIRNRDNRTCCYCGKNEIQNGTRLSVHHIDGEKMQGCEKKWHLVSLCKSCHALMHKSLEAEFEVVCSS